MVALNLSAPFIPQFFKVQLEQLLPYVDILIGNESEAEAYATGQGMAVGSFFETLHSCNSPINLTSLQQDSSISQIASAIANLPKSNASRPRLVVITQGSESTLVASSSASLSKCNIHPDEANPKTYPVPKLSDDQIVDTNGAGDAFAGGFLAAHALGKDLNECIEVGHKMGQMCVGQVGPAFKFPKISVL